MAAILAQILPIIWRVLPASSSKPQTCPQLTLTSMPVSLLIWDSILPKMPILYRYYFPIWSNACYVLVCSYFKLDWICYSCALSEFRTVIDRIIDVVIEEWTVDRDSAQFGGLWFRCLWVSGCTVRFVVSFVIVLFVLFVQMSSYMKFDFAYRCILLPIVVFLALLVKQQLVMLLLESQLAQGVSTSCLWIDVRFKCNDLEAGCIAD